MSEVISKGDVAAREAPGSGLMENGLVTRVVYRGTLESVKAAMPAKGSQVSKGGETRLVARTSVTPLKGGLAEGVVELKAARMTLNVQNQCAVWEVEMAQIEKPLLAHPDYAGYSAEVMAWRASEPGLLAAYKYLDENGQERALAGKALEAAQKIAKGVESYLVFAPVATKTTYIRRLPNDFGKNCGKREAPDLRPYGRPWRWLKTADRCQDTGDGTWARTEQWTGADEWDEDLYEEA